MSPKITERLQRAKKRKAKAIKDLQKFSCLELMSAYYINDNLGGFSAEQEKKFVGEVLKKKGCVKKGLAELLDILSKGARKY